MSALARPPRRRSAPLTVAAMLAAAAFVLAVTIGAALSAQTGRDAVGSSEPPAAAPATPTLRSVQESKAAPIALSAVPQLPALHGVPVHRARAKKRVKAPARTSAPPVRTSAPPARPVAPVRRTPPVAAAPVIRRPAPRPVVTAAPIRRAPVAPVSPPVRRRPTTPSYVGKSFQSKG